MLAEKSASPARARWLSRTVRVSKNTFRIALTQRLNRQIRRMCEHFGCRVRRLTRVRVIDITLDGLAPGRWHRSRQYRRRGCRRSHQRSPAALPGAHGRPRGSRTP
jgi:pseudouridine synthase